MRGSKQACVTLQRPPPEIRTLVRNSEPRSKMEISFSGLARAQAIAAKNPAAPPPTIAICTKHRDADARTCNALSLWLPPPGGAGHIGRFPTALLTRRPGDRRSLLTQLTLGKE